MTIGEVLRRSTQHLEAKGSETPRLDAERLLAHALGITRIELYTQLDRPLTAAELDEARALVARRSRREPLQYVLGEWGFRRLTLRVDPRALIPRPETETLVERALALIADLESPCVLDVGTGTGAVALAIADEHPGARVTSMDVSQDALALAAENVERTGLSVQLLRHDLFEGLPAGPWDLVGLEPPVRRASPTCRRSSRRCATGSRTWRSPRRERSTPSCAPHRLCWLAGGWIALEVGDGQADEVAASLAQLGYREVRITADLAERPRVVEGQV